jgi:hypothetical protein
MQPLKLVALDSEDLQILSAHLQDAVLRVDNAAFLPSKNRFAVIANRFDWEGATEARKSRGQGYQRRRSMLRFERVLGAQMQNLRKSVNGSVLELLAMQFEETDAPEGFVTLVFAGGGAIRLHVECIEAELKDLGPAWETKSLPQHGEDDRPAEDA